jgi:hypothetical protein
MRWAEREQIFNVDGRFPWMAHHAAAPLPDIPGEDRLRVYFGPRDAEERTRVACFEADPGDPARVLHVHDRPSLDLGRPGAFDDSGAMPSGLLHDGGDTYLYYIGWNRRVTVPYGLAIGLAVRTGGGHEFERVHEGPVMDRSPTDPYLVTSPFVLREGGAWRMWYSSGVEWVNVNGRPEPRYLITHAESDDGVQWRRVPVICIVPRSPTEAIGRPWVVRDGGTYRMWYSYRDIVGYRTDRSRSYRIGYAESGDGLSWERLDDDGGMKPSDDGWDSQMVAYPGVYA